MGGVPPVPIAPPAPAGLILAARRLCVQRGNDRILRDVSWEVKRGEHWVILGANGSGKTSLLSALTAYVTPSSGSVEVLGAAYGRADWRALRKRVGLVSSSVRQMIGDEVSALDVVGSGRDAVLNPSQRLRPAERLQASALLRRVECAPLAARPWGVLSQGERQRVLIARALLAGPELLILDEPCAGLDPVARERFRAFLDRLGRRRGGPALVLVTHHVEEIAGVFTHALLLRKGRVYLAAPLAEAVTAPHLSRIFYGAALTLTRTAGGRYALETGAASPRVM